MEKIYDVFEDFNMNDIKISNPISKVGGYYMLKFTVNGSSLYVQPPKCMTKNGIICNKKAHSDLLFSNDNQEFLTWLENMESYCQNHIYENREKWFEGDLDIDDIESYFISPIKFYKSGKYYLVRVNIPTVIGKPSLKIYDESESEVSLSSIKDDVEITSILEFKGIKCSSRSFQIDIEVKQMMKMEPVQLFNRCIIKRNTLSSNQNNEIKLQEHEDNSIEEQDLQKENSLENKIVEDNIVESKVSEISETAETLEPENDNILDVDTSTDNTNVDEDISNLLNNENEKEETNLIEDLKKENISENTINNLGISEEKETNSDNCIEEINLDPSILESSEVMEIKQANEVYYKMYKEAIQRAKVARDLALSSYLEAKNIKNKYMLDEALCESDEDSDLEKELES